MHSSFLFWPALPLSAPEPLYTAASLVLTPKLCLCLDPPYLFQRQGPCAQLKALCWHQSRLCVHILICPTSFSARAPVRSWKPCSDTKIMSMSRSALPLLAPEHLCAAAGHVQTPAKIMCAYFNLPYLFQRQGPCAQLKALCRHQPKVCVHFDLPYLFQRQGPCALLQAMCRHQPKLCVHICICPTSPSARAPVRSWKPCADTS